MFHASGAMGKEKTTPSVPFNTLEHKVNMHVLSPRFDAVGAALPPAVIFEPMELVRAAHEAAAEQALHRSCTFQHLVFQHISEAEADLLIEAEASSMEHRDLGQALRGPLGTLETALREKLERHRRQESEASREALHALSSQLSTQHDEQIRKQAAVLGFSEQVHYATY